MRMMLTGGTTAIVLGTLCSGCGGSGSGLASAPLPPQAEVPAQTPSPGSSPPSTPPALVSNQPFATTHTVRSSVQDEGSVADVAQPDRTRPLTFRYDGNSDRYYITLPGQPEGRLSPTFANDVESDNKVIAQGKALPETSVNLANPSYAPMKMKLTYTSFGSWNAPTDRTASDGRAVRDFGRFAYGIPTASGDIPTSGSASYSALIEGNATFTKSDGAMSQGLNGEARLTFDFGAGTLSGFMDPNMTNNGFQPYEGRLGRFEFANPVYSAGSTQFSGAFLPPGNNAPSGEFAGSFNGPQAAEIMASFATPFQADMKLLYHSTNQIDHLVGTLSGIWIGKKD